MAAVDGALTAARTVEDRPSLSPTHQGGLPPEAIVIATGSEVSLALDAQPQSYRDMVLPPTVRARVGIEAAAPFGWERYVGPDGAIIGVNGFGASAPRHVVMSAFGFT